MGAFPLLLPIVFLSIHGVFFHLQLSEAVKLPFRPEDALPLLPGKVSWLILNALKRPSDLLPTFVGAAGPATSEANGTLRWKGACFHENTAWIEMKNDSGSEFGGGTLHIKVSKAHSWTCMDIYLFATLIR
ncbi:hypothetical protein MLD38_000686 [Melastoma candidum]|uniref:Uncharacterized protein n=1 Tax=Melastoma candidum TaxID=119954 RepID=A0ACB9SC54_9MYRT|nr:hypothetical protein MLD38_000686 [Melastoma candidum]